MLHLRNTILGLARTALSEIHAHDNVTPEVGRHESALRTLGHVDKTPRTQSRNLWTTFSQDPSVFIQQIRTRLENPGTTMKRLALSPVVSLLQRTAWAYVQHNIDDANGIASGEPLNLLINKIIRGNLQAGAAPPIILALSSEIWQLRWKAVEATMKCRDPGVQDALWQLCQNDFDLKMRKDAAESLNGCLHKELLPKVIAGLNSPDHLVRMVSILALSGTAVADIQDRLWKIATNDPKGYLRGMAADALQGVDMHPTLLIHVIAALSSPEHCLQNVAIQALQETRQTSAQVALLEGLTAASNALPQYNVFAEALKGAPLCQHVLAAAITKLREGSPPFLWKAILIALDGTTDPETQNELWRLANAAETSGNATNYVQALGPLHPELLALVRQQFRTATDPDVLQICALALIRTGSPDVRRELFDFAMSLETGKNNDWLRQTITNAIKTSLKTSFSYGGGVKNDMH